MNCTPLMRTRRTQRRLVIAGVLAVSCLFLLSLVVHSQGGPGQSSQLKGKTKEVTPVPDGVVDAGPVVFKKDSDNDGMPDDDERDNGTNPDDPSDADADNDGDGLSNGDEVALGANPNSADSDGDGVSDIDEVRLGYDPTDPNNTPPSGSSLASLRVSPGSVFISINTLLGYEPVQLLVTGVLTDGTTVDLTGGPTLTFQSLDSSVAVVDDFGSVSAVDAGATTIKVISGTVSADVQVVITNITPGPRSSIAIPGYANNVDVAGNYVYVAAGSAGLVVVDAGDRSAPVIVATLSTPGNANDVRVIGTTAYVADGSGGLQIVNVATPASPSIRGSLDTPGEANDVVVYGALAYVADGPSGIQIINVSNPSAPTLVGSTDTPGLAKGIDASGDLIVVADDQPGSVVIIDAAIPASPQIVGSVPMPGYALDLEVRDRFAYVAAFTGGMQVIDFSIPANPRIIGSIENLFYPRDVALGRRYAVAAEVRFFNAVPIIDLGDPSNPIYSGVVDFSGLGDFQGTGIAVDAQHVYMTGSNDPFNTANGVSGSTRLFIGEYLQPENEVSDTAGIAPRVSVIAPQSGQSIIEGERLPISITATDDVRVALVQLIVNGVVVIKDVAAPYNLTYSVPRGATSLTIEAKAFDVAGNNATSPPVTINVLPDPPPTVTITYPAEGQTLFEEQDVYLSAAANDNGSVQSIVFSVNGTPLPDSYYHVPTGVTSVTFGATATDNLGNSASTSRTVSVVPDPPPTITFTNPSEGQQLFEEQDIYLDTYAVDNGSIQSVVFSVNGTPLAGPLYRVPLGVTSITFGAIATDNLGQTASTTRTVDVIPDPPPTIVFSYPAEGQQLFEEQDIYLAVDVTDNGGIDSVVYSVDGTPLDDYYYRVPVGVTSLTFGATATDDRGHSSSTTRTVSVAPDDPPTISIVAPAEGAELMEGSVVEFIADATDNLFVTYVELNINGESFVDWEAPYRQTYTIPTGITSLVLEVAANDAPGHRTVASRTFTVVPDPGTTVSGRVIDTSAQPVPNATVTVFGEFTTQTAADGTFNLPGVPTLRGAVIARVTATIDNKAAANASLSKAPVAGGTTDLGDIALSVLPTAPAFAVATSYVSDGIGRNALVVGYPDRQSLIYEFNNGEFLPSTTAMLPYGAVSSGTLSRAGSFDPISKIFTQSVGQPGSVTDLVLRYGNAQAPVTLSTGLDRESAYTAAGVEGQQRREVLAFLAATGDEPLTVRYRSPNAISDEFDEEADFMAPAVVPVGTSSPLRSLKLADVNDDGLQDIMAIKPVSGSDARLVVIQREADAPPSSFGPSTPTFVAPVESTIITRSVNAARGVNDFAFARGGGLGTHIYVLGDDRIRIYQNNGTGAFLPAGEIILPAGQVPTGITVGDINNDSLTDVLVTTKDANSPESKSLFLYLRTSEENFQPPTSRTYTAPPSSGDTRIIIGEWEGYRSMDAVVVDGDKVIYFNDFGPRGSGS